MARTRIGRSRRWLTAPAAAILTIPLVLGLPASTAGAATPTSWPVDLSVVNGDDVNVSYRDGSLTMRSAELTVTRQRPVEATGALLSTTHRLDAAASQFYADVAAKAPAGSSVEVDVRGNLDASQPGGHWTEWYPAGSSVDQAAVLPSAVTEVQVRVTLVAGDSGAVPAVSAVRLHAGDDFQPATVTPQAGEVTYRIYATREGLVGYTTANGHVIRSRDHFVALPSRRGLSANNNGNYTVKVCTTTGSRCEWAPVWDVGPWNTRDDYWNPSSTREMWRNLPRGKPEAQAAYQDGYNGGRDQFGRRVLNPAGIDLADGTFWDGLRLSNNAWVNVSYLWTGSGRTGVVRTAGDPLNVRGGASTSYAVKGLAANYARVILQCYVRGQTVSGTYGTSNIWNRIGSGQWVADVYLYTGSDNPVVPAC